MKYRLSNRPGWEQNRNRIKRYHFFIFPFSYCGSKKPSDSYPPKLHIIHLLNFIVQTWVTEPTWLWRRLGIAAFVLGRHVLPQIFCNCGEREERILENNQQSHPNHLGDFLLSLPWAQNFNKEFISLLEYLTWIGTYPLSCVLLAKPTFYSRGYKWHMHILIAFFAFRDEHDTQSWTMKPWDIS